MNLVEIQHAIQELPKEQRVTLAAWVAELDQAEWEAEIELDFLPGGRGVMLLDQMKEDARAGKFHPIDGTLLHEG